MSTTTKKLRRGPYEIQAFDKRTRIWHVHGTHTTLKAAEDLAWKLLTRHGGDWRVRRGDQTIGRGMGYRPGETRYTHDRTAIWTRVQKEHA